MDAKYVYSIESIDGRDISVLWDGKIAQCAISGLTHATVDEWYDDLSLGIYRAHYLAGRLKAGFARQSVEIADKIKALGVRKAHEAWCFDHA